ncbi:MAG: hypothetical protein ABL857_02620 [Rickettsiales bacterium]
MFAVFFAGFTIFSTSPALTPNAEAALQKEFQQMHWLETMDFDTHIRRWGVFGGVFARPNIWPLAGLFTLRWPSPPIYGWCYYKKVFLLGCFPIWPRDFNMCYWKTEGVKCGLTNVANSNSTLSIMHAHANAQGRNDDISHAALEPDYYYRDLCVSGAPATFRDFDPLTGEFKKWDEVGGLLEDRLGAEKYDETVTGFVNGVKPYLGTCMKTIDTAPEFPNTGVGGDNDPDFQTPTTGNAGFSYFKNVQNFPFFRAGEHLSKDVYGGSNSYLSSTFFMGGVHGCPAEVSLNQFTSTPPVTPAEWKISAQRCYDYFILMRATHPEWTLERPGPASDDPLTRDTNLPNLSEAGDPNLAIFNACQPLMNGNDSKLVAAGASPLGRGFAPVFQYNRADLDEADYRPSVHLKNDFSRLYSTTGITEPTFPNNIELPVFQDIFPCVITSTAPTKITSWENFNDTMIFFYTTTFGIESGVLNYNYGPALFKSISDNDVYVSPGVNKPGFCPNVEKINIASYPFAPRDDFKPIYFDWSKPLELLGKIVAVRVAYLFPGIDDYDKNFGTDRDYSFLTSTWGPRSRMLDLDEFGIGYESYYPIDPTVIPPTVPTTAEMLEWAKHPTVQCAITPVDIIGPRRASFRNCIMQRIDYNYATWRRQHFLSWYYTSRSNPAWRKPCATRFYEHDNVNDCPTSMSIQQCCRIIVKDVVPMNYVKIRTCEGLRQKRNLIFGYDHIYDADTPLPNPAIVAADAQVESARLAKDNAEDKLRNPSPITTCHMEGSTQFGTKYRVCNTLSVAAQKPGLEAAVTAAREALEIAIVNRRALDGSTETVKIDSPFGKYMKVTDKASYDAAYKENQKLTIVGCDNTEPMSYRFSHYFKQSLWVDNLVMNNAVNPILSAISNGMKSVQDGSDFSITQIREWANKNFPPSVSVNLHFPAPVGSYNLTVTAGIFDGVWQIFDSAKNTLNYGIRAAQDQVDALSKLQQKAQTKYSNLLLRWRSLLLLDFSTCPPQANNSIYFGLEPFLCGTPTTDVDKMDPQAAQNTLLEALGVGAGSDIYFGANSFFVQIPAAYIELQLARAAVDAADTALKIAIDNINSGLKTAEDFIREKIMYVFTKREEHIALEVKGQTDTIVKNTIDNIRTSFGTTASDALDDTFDTINGNEDLAWAMSLLGEGGSHMPYMRWWDTGASAGNPVHGGSFINTLGSYDTIIGVGHEERDYNDAYDFEADERRVKLKAQQPLTDRSRMGRIDGWNGLKGYQMQTLRRSNFNCIGRYEKLFKPGGQEDFVLTRAGANYTPKIGEQKAFPLGWRGYINAPDTENPIFGTFYGNDFENGKIIDGLDNAKKGDIIIYKINHLKRISYVSEVKEDTPRYVKIESWDQGKFPVSTGSGVSWGTGVEQTIYKNVVPTAELNLENSPETIKDIASMNSTDVAKINVAGVDQPSCEDPNFRNCVLGGGADNSVWDTVKIYRPSENTTDRLCPLVDFSTATTALNSPNVNTQELSTENFAYCVNAGFDPPDYYRQSSFTGAGGGAITDTTLCGPNWTGCSTAAAAALVRCFPPNETCRPNDPDTTPPPPPPPTPCTDAEVATAEAEWQAHLDILIQRRKNAELDFQVANDAVIPALDAVGEADDAKAAAPSYSCRAGSAWTGGRDVAYNACNVVPTDYTPYDLRIDGARKFATETRDELTFAKVALEAATEAVNKAGDLKVCPFVAPSLTACTDSEYADARSRYDSAVNDAALDVGSANTIFATRSDELLPFTNAVEEQEAHLLAAEYRVDEDTEIVRLAELTLAAAEQAIINANQAIIDAKAAYDSAVAAAALVDTTDPDAVAAAAAAVAAAAAAQTAADTALSTAITAKGTAETDLAEAEADLVISTQSRTDEIPVHDSAVNVRELPLTIYDSARGDVGFYYETLINLPRMQCPWPPP